jgi:hypothetical protein
MIRKIEVALEFVSEHHRDWRHRPSPTNMEHVTDRSLDDRHH